MDAEDRRQQYEVMAARLEAMGLELEALPGGLAGTATIPLGDEPVPFHEGPKPVKQVRFSTVGADRIKCLEPRPFFYLPLISIADCTDAAELEQRIRAAWQAQCNRVRRTADRLRGLDVPAEAEANGAVLAFDLGVDDPQARARTVDFGQVVLPARGILHGHCLADANARIFTPDASTGSGLDLQIAITTRLEQLAKDSRRRDVDRRAAATRCGKTAERTVDRRDYRVLLVGPRLSGNTGLANSLQVRGYEISTAHNDVEAMDAFLKHSYELMMVDAKLGRCDGLELVLAIQTLAGLERLPVVIVDDHNRPATREKAREIGAVGYLVEPLEAAKIAPGLARLMQAPRYRRYSRYDHRVAVRCGTHAESGFTTGLSRQGMYVCASFVTAPNALEHYELHLAEIGKTLRVEGETIYQRPAADGSPSGLGVRFHEFPEGDEALLIEYLRTLEHRREAPYEP